LSASGRYKRPTAFVLSPITCLSRIFHGDWVFRPRAARRRVLGHFGLSCQQRRTAYLSESGRNSTRESGRGFGARNSFEEGLDQTASTEMKYKMTLFGNEKSPSELRELIA
jgi:hypothetical protein